MRMLIGFAFVLALAGYPVIAQTPFATISAVLDAASRSDPT